MLHCSNCRGWHSPQTRADGYCVSAFSLAWGSFSGSGWGSTCPPSGPNPASQRTTKASPALRMWAAPSERLQELDQRPLVGIAEARLLLEAVGAEVVALVDHEIRALAELEHGLDQVREDLAGLLVGGPHRQRLEVLLDLDKQLEDPAVMRQLLPRRHMVGEQVDVRQQVDRHALGDGAELEAVLAEDRRSQGFDQRPELRRKGRQITPRHAQVARRRRAVDE